MSLMKKILPATLILCGLCVQALDIVRDGKSAFCIYLDKDAAKSVVQGAKDLQDYCGKVTGVVLPIVNEPREPMISLGVNAAAKAAGIELPKDLEWEGFIFKVQKGSLYILGRDTKGGQLCPRGGTSAGTRNGVYTLLEDYFGVRWLMPGPEGDYVPSRSTVSVPDGGLRGEPGFLNRRLPYIQPQYPSVNVWSDRQKLGYSLNLYHGHNWTQTCPPSGFAKHPEWYAVKDGKVTEPSGDFYKLCPTNPSTIKRFAEAACEYFAKHKTINVFSLSPSDGSNWCECDKCLSLYEPDPQGKRSVTPAIIYFYNEVAKLVVKEYPDRILAGYVYAEYVYPPKKAFTLEPNVYLVWAPSFDYGYTLFRPDVRQLFDELLPQWPKITSSLAFYDLPNNIFRNTMGMPNAPGVEILKFLYPRIKKNKMQGVYVYGHGAWGHAALTNYLLAKLAWNPMADVDGLFKDFCDHAYLEASPEMQQFYKLVDSETKAFFNANHKESFTASPGRCREVYAKNLPEFARLYEAGLGKVTDPKARARLEFLKVNLSVMEWNFKQSGYVKEDYKSVFTIDDDEFNAIMANPRYNVFLSKNARLPKFAGIDLKTITSAEVTHKAKMKDHLVRGTQHLVLLAEADGDIEVEYVPRGQYGTINWGYVYDSEGKNLQQVVISKKKPIKIPAGAGQVFGLIVSTRSDFFMLKVRNARWGYLSNVTDEGLHLIQSTTPMYINVPEGVKNFEMWLKGQLPKETAKGVLTSPAGRRVLFNCTDIPVDKQTVEVMPGEDGGFWRLEVTAGDKGYLDDAYVKLIRGIPQIICVEPDKALKANPTK